ncbi:MAG: hypothetical protein ACTSRS_09940 [Candidatus Helarchaeota archaeon]
MLLVSQLTAHLKFTTPAKLPYWMGSAFRGAFGKNLRNICCVDCRRECEECDMSESCLFFYIYMRNKASRGHAPPPKPIILIPPFFAKEYFFQKEGFLDLDLLLIGDFSKYLPHVILGLKLLGQRGIGSMRYENLNRFIIEFIQMKNSKSIIFQNEYIDLMQFRRKNVQEMGEIQGDTFLVKFRTPFTGREFPPPPDLFISWIRNRLIRFVNEYGTQDRVPEYVAEGEILDMDSHFHKLWRRSVRSNKTLFKGYTGMVLYRYSFLNSAARWLLQLGPIIGCGPDSAFGCGFFNIDSVPNMEELPKK